MLERHCYAPSNARGRVVPSPQVPSHEARRNVIELGERANRALHMAVLAMLFAEPGIIEVIPPLIECLRLLPYDPRSFGMTIRARCGSAHVWIGDAFMWRRRSV